jgi:hypothetical protein
MPSDKLLLKREIASALAEAAKDPLLFVLTMFPWGRGQLADFSGPEEWQTKILTLVRDGLLTPNEAIQVAVSSGHGIGKSTLVAWLILWSMSTMVDTKGIVTANTENQLKTKTWSELSKWYHMFYAKDLFELTATALYSVEAAHQLTWRFDMVAWSEHKTEAFAGMHNKGKRIIVIFDEASAIVDKIWEVTEGALTDKDTEIMWFVFGNPTRGSGRFHACFNGMRHRWKHHQIDSRSVSITNKEQIQKWIDDLGEDSDFVRVRVRGVFPNSSEMQFIPNSYVEESRNRKIKSSEFEFAPKILTVDPAWTGGDETVIGLRQGNMFWIKSRMQKNDDDFKLAGLIARFEDETKADAVFIDLGYGTGVYSAGKQMNRNWVLIPFGGASRDTGFVNLRADMWNQMKQWLKNGGVIPNDPLLQSELVGPEAYVVATGKNAGKICLESKEDMKRRGLSSPGGADALALSFAAPVLPKIQREFQEQQTQRMIKNWDPYSINRSSSGLEFSQKEFVPDI